MLPLRYEPAFYTAHLLVRRGVIGEPLLISAQKSYRWAPAPPGTPTALSTAAP
jgi:predicted dehydrogenase